MFDIANMAMPAKPLILSAIGLAAGLFGGLLGIGGSVIIIPAMSLIFGPAQHLYQGAAMIVNFFVALPSVIQHYRAKAILGPIVLRTAPAAIIGVIVGVWGSAGAWFRGTNEVYLSRIFGAFLLYEAAYNVYRLINSHHPLPDIDSAAAGKIPQWKTALLVGLPMGLVGGLLGIGGGVLAVPLQQVFLRIPLRRAIANSAVTILPLSLFGAAYKNYTNAQAGITCHDSLALALVLIPSAVVGGFLGARLTHTLPRRILRIALIGLLSYGGIQLLRRGF